MATEKPNTTQQPKKATTPKIERKSKKPAKQSKKRKTTIDRKKRTRQKAFLKAYQDTNGNVLKAAETAGISRGTHYEWLDLDDRYKKEFYEIDQGIEVELKQSYLLAYARTGNITRAAQILGINRGKHYEWLESDSEYKRAFEAASEEAADLLEAEARRRAVEGVAEPVFYQGMECGTVKKYSDTLLMFLIKGVRPEKYRENIKQEINHTFHGLADSIRAARERVNRGRE